MDPWISPSLALNTAIGMVGMLQRHDHLQQQMHLDAAKLVESLYRGWLEAIIEALEPDCWEALLFYQALSSYEEVAELVERMSVVESIVRSFSKEKTNTTTSPESFIAQLERLYQITKYLPGDVSTQLWSHVMEHLSASSFNRLIGRGRPPLTWRRAIQIQYNLSMLSEWLARHDISNPWDHLSEAVKLLQLAKTLRPGDTGLLEQACPHLNRSQQACLLAAYEPDTEYEDGPVSPLLLHELRSPDAPFIPLRPIALVPLQLAFRAPPSRRMQAPVSTMMPPRVWRMMVTYNNFV